MLAIFLSVLITGQIASDGESIWIEGVQLLSVYLIMAVVFYFLRDAQWSRRSFFVACHYLAIPRQMTDSKGDRLSHIPDRIRAYHASPGDLLLCGGGFAQSADLQYDAASPQLSFAATEIRRAGASPLRITLTIAPSAMKPQSYRIHRTGATIAVVAPDAAGAMYGGLDLAEAIRLGTLADLKDGEHTPYIEKRGIKFNVPLDARTPSYSDNSDGINTGIFKMWSLDFWHEFIDEMARHRYNVLSLWSLHPFPSIVKVPEYPDVALNDVMRTTVPMDDTFSHSGNDMVRPVMLSHLEIVRKMTIDQKIAFWREVMQYAANRGIEVYWFTWNIFMWGAEGKYGITSQQDNPKTIEYFRASVRELVLTYPLLAGIGITAGEHMQTRKDEFASEKWLWRTYGWTHGCEKAPARAQRAPDPPLPPDRADGDLRRLQRLSRHL